MKNFLPILRLFFYPWINTLPLRSDWAKAVLQMKNSTNPLVSAIRETIPQLFCTIFTCIFILLAIGAQATVRYVKTDGSDANTVANCVFSSNTSTSAGAHEKGAFGPR